MTPRDLATAAGRARRHATAACDTLGAPGEHATHLRNLISQVYADAGMSGASAEKASDQYARSLRRVQELADEYRSALFELDECAAAVNRKLRSRNFGPIF